MQCCEIMEIVPGIHQVDGVSGNCYIIVRDGLTLIDTGLPKSGKKILSYIHDTLHKTPGEIRTIILTHYHIDHIGNVYELKNISGAKIAIHERDADVVSGKIPMPAPKGVIGLFIKMFGIFMKARSFQPDFLLKDQDIIAGLTCIHTPGHTPGSICLADPETRVLFVGDTLRFDGQKIEGPPEQFTLDMEQTHRSIKKIASLDFVVLLSGHGIPLRNNASEKVREYCKTL